MESPNRRDELRLEPPRPYVLEAALWLTAGPRADRATLEELGPPDLVSSACKNELIVRDLSSQGLRLDAPASLPLADRDAGRDVWLYLKLFAPWDQESGGRLSLFLRAETARIEARDGTCRLALRFVAKGAPERDAKALCFTDAGRFGVSELYRWLQSYARHASSPLPPPRGLDLDRLPAEIAIVQTGQAAEPPRSGRS